MPDDPSGPCDVLHVVSYPLARGAETYARSLVDELNRSSSRRHCLLTLFAGESDAIRPDVALDVERGWGRRLGLSPTAAWRLRREVAKRRPVAVVAHGGEPAKYAALALPASIPFVYLMIGSAHPLLENPVRRAVRRFYMGRAAAVVAVSSFLAREAESELGLEEGQVRVIPNGREPSIFRPLPSEEDSAPHVVFVGHLDVQKRPALFVAIIADLRRRGHELTAAMIGGGLPSRDLELQAGLAEVDILGERDDIPDLLAAADVLLLTSRPPEGMPGVLIEAGLCGLPVVSTDVPGAADVVEDGVTGFVVGVDDEKGLADSVEHLIADREVRSRMGKAARVRCVEMFSIQSSAKLWEDVLSDVVE